MTARLIDVVVAGIALAIALPLLAVLGVAVRLTSPGPALFRQLRVASGEAVALRASGMTYREIGELLGVKLHTVWHRVNRTAKLRGVN